MRTAHHRLSGWSGPKLIRWIGLLFLAEVGLLGLLGRWPAQGKPNPTRLGGRSLLWLPQGKGQAAGLPDGAVLAEVSSDGFSGPLWRAGDALSFAGRALPGGASQLGGAVRAGSSFTERSPATESPPPARRLPTSPGAAKAAPAMIQAGPETASQLRLSTPLASRQLVRVTTLPVWTNADVLASSTVLLMVQGDGGVLSAALSPPGSGLSAADQEALRLARGLRFEPWEGRGSDGHGFQWGTAEFVWHTVEPANRP